MPHQPPNRGYDPVAQADAFRCALCHLGVLAPTQLKLTLSYDGKSYSADDDTLVCNARGEEPIGERAAVCLLSHRALAPDAMMTATVTRRTRRMEVAWRAHGGRMSRVWRKKRWPYL